MNTINLFSPVMVNMSTCIHNTANTRMLLIIHVLTSMAPLAQYKKWQSKPVDLTKYSRTVMINCHELKSLGMVVTDVFIEASDVVLINVFDQEFLHPLMIIAEKKIPL